MNTRNYQLAEKIRNMNIKATTQEEFETQYYSQVENLQPNQVFINLITSNDFLDHLTRDIKESIIYYSKNIILQELRVKEFYHPKYGQIRRI